MVVAFLQIFHHCQLLCISVGKSANAGWVGSQKIPIVPGWLGKCTGLQNTCTNLPSSPLISSFSGFSNTFFP